MNTARLTPAAPALASTVTTVSEPPRAPVAASPSIPQATGANPTMADLSLEERAEIERAVDGPITTQAIADKIAARGVPKSTAAHTPDFLRTFILAVTGSRDFHQGEVTRMDAEIAELQADRAGMYEGAEWDRKTRHFNSILRSRTTAADEAAFYAGQLATAEAELAYVTGAEKLAAE